MTEGLKGYIKKYVDLSADLSRDEVIAELENEDAGFGLIHDKGGRPLGVVQLSDLLEMAETGKEDARAGTQSETDNVKEIASSEYTKLSVHQTLWSAIEYMSRQEKIYGVITNDSSEPLGIVTIDDLEDAVKRSGRKSDRISTAEARRWLPPLTVVSEKASLNDLNFRNVRGIAVVDDGNRVTGIITPEAVEEHQLQAMFLYSGIAPSLISKFVASPMSDGLTGSVVTKGSTVRCQICKVKNKVQFLDHEHPPACQNPGLRRHKLRW